MLDEIRLGNFKVFREQAIPLRPLTMLSGINGMGKSSVIQSALLLRQSYEQRLLPGTGLSLNGEYVELGRGRDVLFEDATTDDITIGIDSNGIRADWYFAYNIHHGTLDLSRPVTPEIYATSLFGKAFHYLGAERVGPRNLSPISDVVVRDQRGLGIHGEYAGYFLAIYGTNRVEHPSLHHRLTKQGAPTLRSLVTNWIQEVSPGTSLDVNAMDDVDMIRLTYRFERSTGVPSKAFRATNVGFGISYTLPVLVALLSSEPGSLVILENPEAHLHPRGQVKMGELIARAAAAGIQVLVETHSDHVLNGIRVAVKTGIVEPEKVALHFFQRPEDDDGTQGVEVVTPELDSDGRIDYWPDGFFDEYGKTLRSLL